MELFHCNLDEKTFMHSTCLVFSFIYLFTLGSGNANIEIKRPLSNGSVVNKGSLPVCADTIALE